MKVVSAISSPLVYAVPGAGSTLPLQASIVDGDKLSLLGGAYQVGAAGAWVTIPAKAATTGTHAYLVVEQDANRALTGMTPVTIVVNYGGLDPVVISGANATSNILLAEVVGGSVVQRRHGNFTLGLWQIDGDVVRWPETLVGSIPTP